MAHFVNDKAVVRRAGLTDVFAYASESLELDLHSSVELSLAAKRVSNF